MFKKMIALLAVSCSSQFALAGAPILHPSVIYGVGVSLSAFDQSQNGKSDGATAAAVEFLALLYNVPADRILFATPKVRGDWIDVPAGFDDKNCFVDLFRDPKANKYGWVVKSHKCYPAATKPNGSSS